ncbi:hypothetical protein MMC14_007718 [Varicellaria rhodocarpa]|nr:hypothetical protein [Varicellaria rhodocarpa]
MSTEQLLPLRMSFGADDGPMESPSDVDGGLFCDSDGNVNKPFPNKDYCVGGTGNVNAVNKAGDVVSFCQTVLPGNEAMLIPTSVEAFETLTVPGPNYWCSTAAHFYINPPGVGTDEACVWGTSDNAYGNWSPYVAGANTDDSGNTFVKLGWNPIYLEPATPFRSKMPTWGVEIQCDGQGCNGLPCAIDPDTNGVNEMVGANTDGAGGAAFCVVTVPKGVNANFVVFEGGLSSAGSSSGAGSSSAASLTPSVAVQNAVVHQSSVSSAAASSSPPSSSSAPASTSSSPPSATSSSSSSPPSTTPSSSSSPPSTTPSSSSLPPSTTSSLASVSSSAAVSTTATAAASTSTSSPTTISTPASSSTSVLSIASSSSIIDSTSINDTTSSVATASSTIGTSSTVFTLSYPTVSNSPHILIQNNTSGYSGASLTAPTSTGAGAGAGAGVGAGAGTGTALGAASATGAAGSVAASGPSKANGYKRNVTGAGLCLSFLAAIMVYAL